jgi:hypothetical protein
MSTETILRAAEIARLEADRVRYTTLAKIAAGAAFGLRLEAVMQGAREAEARCAAAHAALGDES